jgi:hypothetical protein
MLNAIINSLLHENSQPVVVPQLRPRALPLHESAVAGKQRRRYTACLSQLIQTSVHEAGD